MNRLPVVSGRQMVAALERIGYQVARQKGSQFVCVTRLIRNAHQSPFQIIAS